ncbi:MAG: glycosyltransferase family 2 protein [Candidatus Omnitrophota bacterium]
MKLSIIIPIYNEQATVAGILRLIKKVKFPVDYEIVIIDDASADATYQTVMSLGDPAGHEVKVFRNDVNRGKGYSIRRGIAESEGDIIIVQDADNEYDPNDIPRVIEPIMEGGQKVVYGSRFLGRRRPDGMAMPNFIANKFLTFLTCLLFGIRITDMETCYKALSSDIARRLKLRANRFTFEPEVTAQIAKLGVNIAEVPISYHGRSTKQGKKIKARDFFYAVGVLICQRLSR